MQNDHMIKMMDERLILDRDKSRGLMHNQEYAWRKSRDTIFLPREKMGSRALLVTECDNIIAMCWANSHILVAHLHVFVNGGKIKRLKKGP
jgi:hypothetical protein